MSTLPHFSLQSQQSCMSCLICTAAVMIISESYPQKCCQFFCTFWSSHESPWKSQQQQALHHHHHRRPWATLKIEMMVASRSCVTVESSLILTNSKKKWPVLSKPHVSPLEVRLQESNWLPRLPESPLLPPVVSRSLTDTDLVPSLFVRSEDTKSPLSSWSESFLSRDLSEKSPKISRLTWDSKDLPSWLFKRLLRLTLLVFSRIPTWPPSTPRESPSCLRTSNLPAESVASALKHLNPWTNMLIVSLID